MAAKGTCFGKILSILVLFCLTDFLNCYDKNFVTPEDCLDDEYFDISQLNCVRCRDSSLEVRPDGLGCQCANGYRLTKDYGGGEIECAACAEDEFVSTDGYSCVACETTTNPGLTCPSCSSRQATVERELNGDWGLSKSRRCEACIDFTSPNGDGTKCEQCNQIRTVLPPDGEDAKLCECPADQLSGGLCFETADDLPTELPSLWEVSFGGDTLSSHYLYTNVRAAFGMCQQKYNNVTACQALGNMCTMVLYRKERTGGDTSCDLYDRLKNEAGSGDDIQEWTEFPGPPNMPWLYYEDSQEALEDLGITTQYRFPNDRLNFTIAQYNADGDFLGMTDVFGGVLQLCKSTDNKLDAAYDFGTTYRQSCQVNLEDYFDPTKYETVFYDMYLEYQADSGKRLYAVPVLIKDYNTDNAGSDRSKWQLMRRFFLVDNLSGRSFTFQGAGDVDPNSVLITPAYIRYATSITLHIELQQDSSAGDGFIFPPYLEIDYSDAALESPVKSVSFDVRYRMNLDKYNNDVAISIGVLSALAIVYSAVQTWGWSKRAGKLAIDFVTIIKFLMYNCGNLANVFFVVTFGSSVWWIIFYKQQNTVYLIVPEAEQERRFVSFLATGFALKFIQLLHMVICQCQIDIFFIDWERPRGGSRSQTNGDGSKKAQGESVSTWRTYFAANEWNEIQTCRKINHVFQLFCVVFFLEVIGFGNVATAQPRSDFQFNEANYTAPYSRIFRYAMGGLVYLIVAVIQWIFSTFIYERFIDDNVRQYVDFCSMSNISVFILENDMFGYYIHGRSVHGCADTGMREMHENLKREEEDLCGQRGLLPNTENQTFMVGIPRKLRVQYNKVMMPIAQPMQGAAANAPRGQSTGGATANLDGQVEKKIQAHGIINRFLQSFIDHSLRDIDYIIKDKLLFESILNVEFMDSADKGFFYNDDGHSFDAVLFCGNETTLTIFEILLFSLVDLIAGNFVLAAIIVYIVMKLVCMVRESAGRSNLAKKTLVDKRFLI